MQFRSSGKLADCEEKNYKFIAYNSTLGQNILEG